MATNLPDGGSIADNSMEARECGLASVLIGGFLIVAVGIGFLLNWQTFLHARNTMSPFDIQLSAAVTSILILMLVWVAVTGLRLTSRAGVGLAEAGRTLNIVALIHLGFFALNAAAIYHSIW